MKNFKGIYAATIVPLKKDKSIDKHYLNKHLKQIINTKGIRGLLINGHAGENFTLSESEQVEVIKIAKKNKTKNTLLVSGLNFEDPIKASKIAINMQNAGADAIMIFPPFSWSQGVDENMIINHHKIICSNIKIPVFLYQSSVSSGNLAYTTKVLKQLINIKGIIGIKEGSWNFKRYVKNYKLIRKNSKSFLIMASGDEHLYPCFKYKSDGSLVSLAAVVPEMIVEMIELINKKKHTKAKQIDKKLLILAKNIYGKQPASFSTARIKYCLKLLKKVPNEIMRSSIKLDIKEKTQLKNSLKASVF
tara:strand:+ start:8407 stop:9318 length:912 start_codon:yes stop_codon:yes gene_type:complete